MAGRATVVAVGYTPNRHQFAKPIADFSWSGNQLPPMRSAVVGWFLAANRPLGEIRTSLVCRVIPQECASSSSGAEEHREEGTTT